MSEYDQERISELAEELDRAKEKIRCLEAEIRDLKAELHEAVSLEQLRYLSE